MATEHLLASLQNQVLLELRQWLPSRLFADQLLVLGQTVSGVVLGGEDAIRALLEFEVKTGKLP